MRVIYALLLLVVLSIPTYAGSTFTNLPAATQPIGETSTNGPTYVPMDQGSGCALNVTPCTTAQSDALRLGQPIQTNCAAISSPWQYQECIDTSLGTPELKEYIGSTWWPLWSLSPSTGPVIVAIGSITVGSTPVMGGSTNCLLYDTSGSIVGCSTALPNGTTATTQAAGDGTTDVATDAFALGTTAQYTGTGSQAVTAVESDWNAIAPAASITFNLPATPNDHDCRSFVNDSQQYTYPMIVSGNGKDIGPAGDTAIYANAPGPMKVCYSSATGYWSQSL